MKKRRILTEYNQIALAVFLTWALIFLGAASFSWFRATQQHTDDVNRVGSNKSNVTGEEFETSQGVITAYKSESPDDPEALQGVRYVAMSNGKVTAISDDEKTLVYGEKGVGKLGRIALIKTGERKNRPIFDVVFISFPDLDRHVIARSIDSLDTVQQLDDNKFSAIVWYNLDEPRFVIVDAKTGLIQATRNLNFSGSSRKSGNSSGSKAAAAAGAEAAEAAEAAPQSRLGN